MIRSTKTLCATLFATLFATVPAAAQAQTHSFAGSCALQGTLTFASPIGTLPSSSWDGFTSAYTGTCNGKLDGQPLPTSGAPVSITNAGTFLPAGSCTASLTLNTTGVVTLFPGDPQREATIHGGDAIASGVGGVETGIGHGAVSGYALEYGLIPVTPQVLQQCSQGTLTQVSLSLQTQTITPIVG
jgi:hypothetical protein